MNVMQNSTSMEPIEQYISYLIRTARTSNKTLYELHQLALSHEVAIEYGVTKEQMLELDLELAEQCHE